jgi:hypothetical protein
LATILSAAFLSACEPPPQPEAVAGPLPKQICSKVAEGIKKLAETPMFEHNGPAQATLAEEIWLPMEAPQRDQIVQLLAFDAACKSASPPAEQQVTIRSETGRLLVERIVETRPDLGTLLQD